MTTVPVALAGSIAVSLGTVPAQAAEPRARDAETGPIGTRPGGAWMVPRAAAKTNVHSATYVVREGDTVTGIAIRNGLRTVDLLTWNGLTWSSIIHPGQVLRLAAESGSGTASPAPRPSGAGSHTVVAGETVSAIAAKHGLTTEHILEANGLSPTSVIYPGQTLALPGSGSADDSGGGRSDTAPQPVNVSDRSEAPSGPSTHTVVAGDTLYGIAATHGVSVSALLAANDIGEGAIIYPDQKLEIPGDEPEPSRDDGQLSAVLDGEQAANAQTIIRIGRDLGVPDRGIAIALATAMVESSLRNLDGGDRDSVGLFQQRPSQGWGHRSHLRDAEHATRLFFGGPGDPNGDRTRGLLDFSGWHDQDFSDAAQAVQISAYPDRYGRWQDAAHTWLAHLG